ncbi:MAG TPA: hypothetical protein VFS43_47675 [Polyangiaceae bacterium]|nr:hypothetical protein [Polyangiaceae bacterium]
MSPNQRPLAALAFAATLIAARPAGARPKISDWVKAFVAERYDVPQGHLTIQKDYCHLGSAGTPSFRDRPFTQTLLGENGGAEFGHDNPGPALDRALAAIDAKGTDSDCDGYPDLLELSQNSDPSNPRRHPSGDPTAAPCAQPPPAPAPGDDDDDDSTSGSGGASPQKAPGGDACSLSSPARPLDPDALTLTALVALSLARRARPRA